VNVTRLLGAHESGRVINRLTYDNQSFGGMTQGLAFGMTEGRIMDAGQTGTMVNRNWLDYKIPTSKEIPLEFVTVPVEGDVELCNNLGSKGLGEPPVIPTAAAIANAIFDATGVRPTKTPVTPVEMIRLLSQKGRA
jgi:xanthine dehydrogenase YagR molybdenum-binding subunit